MNTNIRILLLYYEYFLCGIKAILTSNGNKVKYSNDKTNILLQLVLGNKVHEKGKKGWAG